MEMVSKKGIKILEEVFHFYDIKNNQFFLISITWN